MLSESDLTSADATSIASRSSAPMLGPGIGAEEREAIEVASALVRSDSESIFNSPRCTTTESTSRDVGYKPTTSRQLDLLVRKLLAIARRRRQCSASAGSIEERRA